MRRGYVTQALIKLPRIAVFDIESNGLLDTVTQIWCIWIKDPISNRSIGYKPHEIDKAITHLESFDILVGHNIIDFDIPCIKKFYPSFKPKGAFDTLTLSRMVEPDRLLHGLKSYGKELENLKGDYAEDNETAWDAYSEEMFDYCAQDVNLNVDVYYKLCGTSNMDPANPPYITGEELLR
jgi:hypothetical protein